MGTGGKALSLIDLLQARSQISPDLPVQTFLADGQRAERVLTSADLLCRARAIGAVLQQNDLAGLTILLLYPPGLDFVEAFFGCLFAGAIAVPAYPPKANRSFSRLRAIVRDAGAAGVLSIGPMLGDIRDRLEGEGVDSIRLWLATDEVPDDAAGWREPRVTPDSLAFLQYTSGSTGEPKGVMVSHANILHNSECLKWAFSLSPQSVGVCWLPSFHDMGLITGVIAPVYTGFRHYIMAPAAFLQKPVRWLEAISRLRATFSGGPNSAYELCLRSISPEQCRDLDLSSWTVAFNGAEPIRAETLQRFAEAFAPYGFDARAWLPGYGMAEATLMISCGPTGSGARLLHARESDLQQHQLNIVATDAPDAVALVGSGQTAPDTEVAVVLPERLTRCPAGQIGELWVRGPSVAQGYWQRREQSEATFAARIADTGEGPFLRTGDLGYVSDNQVFVTGRLKDLIIVAGRNFYPQDIEATVEACHPALNPGTAAAFSLDAGRQERLGVAVEVQRQHRRNVNAEEIFAAIRRSVAEQFELQVHAIALLQPNGVPKTSSGKIQRRPCREAFMQGQLDTIALWQAPLDDDETSEGAAEFTSQAIEAWLATQVAWRVGCSPEQVDVNQPFAAFGFGSLEAVTLAGQLERWLGRPVPQTLLYDQPSIAAVGRWLGSSLVPLREGSRAAPARSDNEPIAIVGMGCRFPSAHNPGQFWRVLRDGVDCVRKVPAGRFAGDPRIDDPRLAWGGFLDGIDRFDADFFGLAPREVAHMDPQQRLLLEVAWETLEHAGCDPRRLGGTATGVFVGISGNDYLRLLGEQARQLDAYVGTGNAGSIAANRLSYFLDLRGPSLAVDTACSSSLVAVHLACRSLRAGECRAALVGGVNLVLSPEITRVFAQAGMLAADGRCKTFAAEADGYVRGEGCGMVLLKRLSDALADGDRVLAVIRGTAVNQDGRSNGLTAPNGPAQEAVIRAALADAGVNPLDVDYVEAHGTGTELGDPIEVQALGAVLCPNRPASRPLRIGSVKTNIGHLEAAAGIAGLIKVVLSLEAGELPPHLHLSARNPLIPWDSLPIEVTERRTGWSRSSRLRLAGVSSFGFGGTNAHVILGEAPVLAASAGVDRSAHLLVLSARDEQALRKRAGELREALVGESCAALADVCFTLAHGRSHFEQRLALPVGDRQEAVAALEGCAGGAGAANAIAGRAGKSAPKVAFLFTGQGSQYTGMARQLFETQPTFRQALLRCDAVFAECRGRSLVDLLYGESADEALLERTLNAQPALFAVEWALAQLWMSWGIVPAALMGHSLGEYVAACVAGAFTVEDGLRFVAARARLMDEAPGRGRMVAVFAGPEQVEPLLQDERLSIAAVQAQREVVVSGAADALEQLVRRLDAAGLTHVPLRVSHAFHSPLMEPILPAFREVAGEVRFASPRIPVVSNLTGRIVPGEQLCRPDHWVRHLRQPVRFAAGMRTLIEEGVTALLEIGPHPVLVSMGQRTVDVPDGLWLASLRRGGDDWQTLLESLGRLYVGGAEIDWQGLDRHCARRKVSLPTYPFQRRRHWFESRQRRNDFQEAAALASDADQWLYEVRWQPKRVQPGLAAATFLGEPAALAAGMQGRAVDLARRDVPDDEDQLLGEIEDLCIEYVLAAMEELGLTLSADMTIDAQRAASRLGVLPRHQRLFERLLVMLAEVGLLRRSGETWLVQQSPARAAPARRFASLQARYTRNSALLQVVGQCGPHLAEVLRGRVDPLTLLFPQDGGASAEELYRDAPGAKVLNALAGDLIAEAIARAPSGRPVRILEIGAGTGGTTSAVLRHLPTDRAIYTFTDVSAYFLSAARKRFGSDPRLRFETLDIDRDPLEQSFQPHAYDIVLAANVLHATPDLRRSLAHVNQLLASGGMLVLLEGTAPRRCLDLTFGLLEGWWSFRDTDLRPGHALLSASQWRGLLAECGHHGVTVLPSNLDVPGLADQRLIVSRGPVETMAVRPSPAEGTWLIVPDAAGLGGKLADRLRFRGATCIEASDVGLLSETSSPRSVVFLQPLDFCEMQDVATRQTALLSAALQLAQSVAGQDRPAKLWFVTRGAQWTGGRAGPANPAQSALAGLAQVIALEQPNLWGGLIDLDPQGSDDEADLLAELLLAGDDETSVALRGGLAMVPRLCRSSPPESLAGVSFRGDATYLLTGGVGGVGLAVARWMVEKGARHLSLLSRRGMPGPDSPQEQSQRELESLGATIEVLAGDVGDRESLRVALDAIRAGGRPLRGIVHAAGVPGSRELLQISDAELAAVLRPKLAGAWHLHELTADDSLEFFVCFSSASSILGANGQAHYAAANRCLDALVAYRRSRGLPGLSVNWGRWGTTGMLTAEAHAQFAEVGLRPMDPAAAAGMLGRLMVSDASQVLVAAVDWSVFQPLYEARRARPLLESIEIADAQADGDPSEPSALAKQVRAAPAHRRRDLLVEHIEREVLHVLGMPSSRKLDRSAGFFEMGMDSLMAVTLRGRLQKQLGRDLSKTLAFEHPSIDVLADFLLAECFSDVPPGEPTVAAETQCSSLTGLNEPIAIIGASCRLPRSADLESFWRLLAGGVDAVSEVPADRWDIGAWYHPDPDAPGRMYTRCGGFIEAVDAFDPQFFSIAPREAAAMDPQHRLLLEVAWEALENAACSPASLKGSRTAVLVGATASDYTEVLAGHAPPDAYYITGNSLNAAAGRISYLLGLHGPSMVVDAACASSLVAVHLACRSLRSGECDAALAGGVNLILSPRGTVAACRAKMLSPSGRCRTFDAAADGFVRSEGCGMIVLKRLRDAQAAGDRVLAVIRGTAIGQDGASGGLTVPNASAQQDVIRRALEDAGVSPAEIDYIEAHGTGTALGDPIEVRAIGNVFGNRDAGRPLMLGSVKTNLGHLESASGIAGLIKVILALRNEQIPPHLHLREVNPAIDLAAIPATIPTAGAAWPQGERPRLAGVSAFGASGTLAHVVVAEPPRAAAAAAADEPTCDRPQHVLAISARSEPALRELARRLADEIDRQKYATPADVCFAANTGRSHFENRWAIVCGDRGELASKLRGTLGAGCPAGTSMGFADRSTLCRVAFVIDPRVPIDVAAVRKLRSTSPAFRAAMDRCEQVLRQAGLSLDAMLDTQAPSDGGRMAARLAVQWSVAQLWRCWGIEPAAVCQPSGPAGFADCVAGSCAIEDALAALLRPDGPVPALAGPASAEIVRGDASWPDPDVVVPLSVSHWADLLDRLGRLYVRGASIDWAGFDRGYRRRKLALPTYPFQRQRCWVDSLGQPVVAPAPAKDGVARPLVGRRLSLPVSSTIHYEAHLSAQEPAYLRDHRVAGWTVLPATAYVEMALAGGVEQLHLPLAMENVSFDRPMLLPDGCRCSVQTVLTPQSDGRLAFQIFSRRIDGPNEDLWALHAAGSITRCETIQPAKSLDSVRAVCTEPLQVQAFYRQLAACGLAFGKAFQGIRSLWRGPRGALGYVQLGPELAPSGNASCLHPALLDACSQVVGAALLSASAASDLYLLVGVDRLVCCEPAGSEAWCYASASPTGSADPDRYRADLVLYDAAGRVIAKLEGLTYQRVATASVESIVGSGGAARAAAASNNGHSNGKLRSRLRAAAGQQRLSLLESHIRQQVARILGLSEWPEPRSGFFDLGMDSLSATELVASLQQDLDVPVPATLIFEHGNCAALAEFLCGEVAPASSEGNGQAADGDRAAAQGPLDNMTTDELADLFARTLNETKGLTD